MLPVVAIPTAASTTTSSVADPVLAVAVDGEATPGQGFAGLLAGSSSVPELPELSGTAPVVPLVLAMAGQLSDTVLPTDPAATDAVDADAAAVQWLPSASLPAQGADPAVLEQLAALQVPMPPPIQPEVMPMAEDIATAVLPVALAVPTAETAIQLLMDIGPAADQADAAIAAAAAPSASARGLVPTLAQLLQPALATEAAPPASVLGAELTPVSPIATGPVAGASSALAASRPMEAGTIPSMTALAADAPIAGPEATDAVAQAAPLLVQAAPTMVVRPHLPRSATAVPTAVDAAMPRADAASGDAATAAELPATDAAPSASIRPLPSDTGDAGPAVLAPAVEIPSAPEAVAVAAAPATASAPAIATPAAHTPVAPASAAASASVGAVAPSPSPAVERLPDPRGDRPAATAMDAAATPSVPVDVSARPAEALQRSEPERQLPPPNPVERAVAGQVSRAVVRHLPDGGERLVIRLTPPELGTVRVEFTSRDGMMTARLVAEDDGVRQALDRALPIIKSDLRSEHPTLDIAVSTSRDDAGRWNADRGQQQAQQQTSDGQPRRRDGEPAFSLDDTAQPEDAAPARSAPVLGRRATLRGVDALA